ncbi:MAG: T9SS type A sorting domain-containing protein [Bacteroidia bacterium]|nr:T9SS type A sorting domain-containing protein [Bacteroidia bacterium]
MRNIILFIHLLVGLQLFGQRISSSCDADSNIIMQYKNDADRLALRRIYKSNLDYKNETAIPDQLSDTILKVLIAVFNAKTLPQVDTITSLLKIHSFPSPVLNDFHFRVDTNLSWSKNLRRSILPCNEPKIDSIIELYHLKIRNAYDFIGDYMITLSSDSNYNLFPLTEYIEKIQGIRYCEVNGFIGDGSDISDSVKNDRVVLTYSYGWGDCPAGCIYRRYWRFNIYYDCSVEFVRSYGSKLSHQEQHKKLIKLKPNPFRESIHIMDLESSFSYSISNFLGQEVISGISENGVICNLDVLNPGIYILSILYEKHISIVKIIKE